MYLGVTVSTGYHFWETKLLYTDVFKKVKEEF